MRNWKRIICLLLCFGMICLLMSSCVAYAEEQPNETPTVEEVPAQDSIPAENPVSEPVTEPPEELQTETEIEPASETSLEETETTQGRDGYTETNVQPTPFPNNIVNPAVQILQPTEYYRYDPHDIDSVPLPLYPTPGYKMEFYVGNQISDIPEVASSLADAAMLQLEAYDNYESPIGSDSIKYNEWYYGRRICNAFIDGQFIEQYNWNTVFVCWCADYVGLIDLGRFPVIADSGSLHYWLCEAGYDQITKNDLYREGGFAALQRSDLIFLPADSYGYEIGIVVDVQDEAIAYVTGDMDYTVKSVILPYEDCSETITFIRVPQIEDYGLYILTRFLIEELHLNLAAASGIIANMQYESMINSRAVGDNGSSIGLCQWHDERWDYLVNFCSHNGYDWRSSEGQLWFLKYELETEYYELLDKLRRCENSAYGAYEAAYYFCFLFENPDLAEVKADERGNFAFNTVFDKLLNNS